MQHRTILYTMQSNSQTMQITIQCITRSIDVMQYDTQPYNTTSHNALQNNTIDNTKYNARPNNTTYKTLQ